MLRYLATAALPPGQPVNEELIASIAPMLDQVGSVFGEVRNMQAGQSCQAPSFAFGKRGWYITE